MKEFYRKEEIEELLGVEEYDIPAHIEQIKIDVGLAGEAPNSAMWISHTDNRYVFGIEPLKHHWNMLTNFDESGTTREHPRSFPILQLHDKTIKLRRNTWCSIEGRFTGLECAIDNVDSITEQVFYEMDRHLGGSGSSSLLAPSDEHPLKLNDTVKVKTISLEMLLNKIPWSRFPYIEHIKTDCEGKDFDVVKSIGKYLQKVVYITSEMTNNTHHVIGSNNQLDFINFMADNGFKAINLSEPDADGMVSFIAGDIQFVNLRFLDIISKHNLNNDTLGV